MKSTRHDLNANITISITNSMSYHLWSSFFIYHSPQIISLSCPLYSEQVTESVFARSGEWFSNLNEHQNLESSLRQVAGICLESLTQWILGEP